MKTALLFITTLALLFLQGWKWLTATKKSQKKPRLNASTLTPLFYTPLSYSSLFYPLLLFISSVLVSSFIAGSQAVDNLWGMGGVYLSIALIVLIGPNLIKSSLVKKKFIPKLLLFLQIGATLLSLFFMLSLTKIVPTWLVAYLRPESPLITLQIMIVIWAGVITQHLKIVKGSAAVKGNSAKQKSVLLNYVYLVILTVGIGLNLFLILPGKTMTPLLPSLSTSLSVTAQMWRKPKTLLVGAGPNNYHIAYSLFKPVWVNQTQLWNIQFNQATDLPLTLAVSTGLVAVISWLWLIFVIVKHLTHQPQLFSQPLSWMVLTLLGLQLLLPPSTSLLILFALILTAWLSLPNFSLPNFSLPAPSISPKISQTLGVLTLVFTFGLSYFLGRALLAEYKMSAANQAGRQNNMTHMYELQQKAISLNPFLPSYHRRYALTNLAIATALSNKTDLTQDETDQALKLIQQAVRESQTATRLQPADVRNWEIMAQTYSNLIGIAKDADQWTVTAYSQAITAAPTDPSLRIALGKILYENNQYSAAQPLFQQAIDLKPDLVNAHYYLAKSLVKQKQYSAAIAAYEETLALLEPGAENYQTVAAELNSTQTTLAQPASNGKQ